MKEFIERLVLCVPGTPLLPVWAGLNSAGVDGDCVLALLTANRAAPGKLAGAALHHLRPARSVSWPAAHQLAAVGRQARGSWAIFFFFFLENREKLFEPSFQNKKYSAVCLSCALVSPLHRLPAVPGMPFSGSRWQKSGEGAR